MIVGTSLSMTAHSIGPHSYSSVEIDQNQVGLDPDEKLESRTLTCSRHRVLTVFVAISVIFLCLLGKASGQACRVDDVRFHPPNPQPSQRLELEVSVASTVNTLWPITITIITQTDLNKNFTIDPGE